MSKLSQTIRHIYDRIFKVLIPLEIRTENSWEPVEHLMMTEEQDTYILQTSNGYDLECSGDHIIIAENGDEVFAKNATGVKIKTNTGPSKIINVEKTGKKKKLYDLSLNGKTHTYFANGVLSHNCVIADEFSFVPNNIASKVFESIYPVISSSKTS